MTTRPDTPAPKLKVFISYSRRDIEVVDRLEQALHARGMEPLIDRSDIEKLEDWWLRIEQLIGQADTVVFVLSPNFVASEICRREATYAAGLSKRLAPVVVSDVEDSSVPPELARLNYVFCRPADDFDRAMDDLATALGTDVEWVREHTRLGELARRWDGRGRPGSMVLRGDELEAAERWIATRPANAPEPSDLDAELIAVSRNAATRRMRAWLTGAVGAAVVAGGLAILAEVNRQQAVEQRLRVERILEKTTEATKDLVVNVADRYAARRGIPKAMIIDILKQARRLVEELNSVGETRPELLRNGGLALAELSDALRAQGDRGAALETALATVAVFTRLRQAQPGEAAWHNGLILGYDRLGDVHFDLGQRQEAKAAYEAGAALVANVKNDEARRRFEAVMHENLGTLSFQQGDYPAALGRFEASLQLREDRLAHAPGDAIRQRDLAVAHEKRADTLLAQGETEAAQKAYERSLELTAKIATAAPDDTQAQRDLATAYHKLGNAFLAAGAIPDALTYFQKDVEISKALHDSDPQWREWREDLLVGYERIGNAAYRGGDPTTAVEYFVKALDHARQIALDGPSQSDWLRTLSKLYQSACLALFETGDGAQAFALAREGADFVQARVDAGLEVRDILGDLRNNVAWFALFNEAFAEALENAEQAIATNTDRLLFKPNRAHALMFLHRRKEARSAYLEHKDDMLDGSFSWARGIVLDFSVLREAGLTHPLMVEIEKALTGADPAQ